jgi:ABC-type lipoprotein export system ATPase subunit
MLSLLSLELGKTVVMVTHDLLAADHAGRRLHLDKGIFQHAGTVQ